MQEHHYSVDIEASPDELWQLFWARIPHTETGEVTIDILHPGDAVGEAWCATARSACRATC